MRQKNIFVEYDSIPYGAFAALGSLDELPPGVVTDRATALARVERTPATRILAVAPTSMATGYKLAQTPLTAIDLEALPAAQYDDLAAATERDLASYTLLVLGRPPQHTNHTLGEYA